MQFILSYYVNDILHKDNDLIRHYKSALIQKPPDELNVYYLYTNLY